MIATQGGTNMVDPRGGARSKTTGPRPGVNLRVLEDAGEAIEYEEQGGG